MTLQLGRGRAVKIKINRSVVSLQERIKSYIDNKINENAHVTKMASFAIIGALIPISAVAVNTNQPEAEFKSEIKLAKNATIFAEVDTAKSIVPGESKVQAEARVAAENAQKAVLAARAKTVVAAPAKVYNDPATFDGLYQSAGAAYGIDWRILKAIHYVETGASGSTSKRNPSGATGPMQFIPSTWRAYGVDGNGDGVKDITNVNDAIYAAANYLRASGGGVNNYKTSLWSYNPSTRYYSKVMEVARSLGF